MFGMSVYFHTVLTRFRGQGNWLFHSCGWKNVTKMVVVTSSGGFLHTRTHTRLTALFTRTTLVSWCKKAKTSLDFTEARDSEWQ